MHDFRFHMKTGAHASFAGGAAASGPEGAATAPPGIGYFNLVLKNPMISSTARRVG